MKSFDLLSDLHADFWLKEYKRSKQLSIDLFVDDLLPARPSEVLLIAGDLGHHNHDSELLLKSFKRYYSYVLFVAGNHDYYLVNSQERWNNNDRSINRMMDLKKRSAKSKALHAWKVRLLRLTELRTEERECGTICLMERR